MKKRLINIFFVTVIFLLGVVFASYANSFPDKEITFVVQSAAGGGSDLNCKSMGAAIEPILGVPTVSIYKTGAGGGVGLSYLANSKPDGYTVGNIPVEVSMLSALGYADINPDNFDLICRTGYFPAGITVKADSPWKTVDEFFNYAKENPGVITIGNGGFGSIWHIAALKLEKELGIQFTHVPFSGTSTAVVALMGGHISCNTGSPTENSAGIKSGDLRLLAVMSDKRSDLFPEVPTLKELGYDIQTSTWMGFGCPKGIPEEVKEILVETFKKGYESEIFQKNLFENYGIEKGWMGPKEFEEFAKSEYEIYSKLIPELGLGQK